MSGGREGGARQLPVVGGPSVVVPGPVARLLAASLRAHLGDDLASWGLRDNRLGDELARYVEALEWAGDAWSGTGVPPGADRSRLEPTSAGADAGEPQTDLLTYDEAAHVCNVSRRTIERWVASGDLEPVALAGRVRRLRRADVEAMIERKAVS